MTSYGVRDPVHAVVDKLGLASVLGTEGLEDLVNVVNDNLIELSTLNVGNGTDGELSDNLSRDDGFSASTVESTLNTVDGEGWVAPTGLESRLDVVVDQSLRSNVAFKTLNIKVDGIVKLIFFWCQRSNHLLDTGDEDFTLGSNKLGEDVGNINHRLVNNTAKRPEWRSEAGPSIVIE